MRTSRTLRRLVLVALGAAVAGTLSATPARADLDGPITFYFRNNGQITLGNSGDLPLVGDWDADGDHDIDVYRPSDRTFYPHMR